MTVRTAQWLKDYFMERDPDDYNRDLVDSFGQSAWALGRGTVYFVAYGGDDAQPGTDPNAPLETITQALSLCSDDVGDYIYVMSWYQNEAGPINCNKRAVSIIGAVGGSVGRPHTWMFPTGDTAMFTITAQGTIIDNLLIEGGVSHGAIEYIAGLGNQYSVVRNCFFGFAVAAVNPAYGVWAAGVNMPANYSVVEHCTFGPQATINPILWNTNGPWCRISDNHFDAQTAGGVSILVTGGGAAGQILRNSFALNADASGRAITMSGSNQRWWIDGNRAHFGRTSMAQNPFRDIAGAAVENNWGVNWNGEAATLPVAV